MMSDDNLALRERFYSDGLEEFSPCDAMALILSFVLPRGDNRVLAAHLIERFGSFHNVFNVPYDALKEEELNETTVAFLRMMPAFSNYYLGDRSRDVVIFDSYTAMGNYALSKIGGRDSRILSLILLSADSRFIAYEVIAAEHVSISDIPLRRFGTYALKYKAEKAVIVTNHPDGTLQLSTQESCVATAIVGALSQLNISVVDEIIVANERFSSLAEIGVFQDLVGGGKIQCPKYSE